MIGFGVVAVIDRGERGLDGGLVQPLGGAKFGKRGVAVAQKHVESGQHHYGIGRDVHKSIIALSRGGRKRGEMPKGR